MAFDFTDIIYEKHHRVRGAAWITINRPDVMNAFTNHTAEEMDQAFADAESDPAVGVVVLTGVGNRAFTSGGDVKQLLNIANAGGKGVELDPGVYIERTLKPVIARVNGLAIGGGNALAYTCDFSIACEEHARFGQVGPRVGSPAAGWEPASLAYVVGMKRAKEMWMMCRQHDAHHALEMGLVNRVVPCDRLDAEVDQWCIELLEKSTTCLRILKASFNTVWGPVKQPGRKWVQEINPEFYSSGESAEGQTAFFERRPPDFARFRTATQAE